MSSYSMRRYSRGVSLNSLRRTSYSHRIILDQVKVTVVAQRPCISSWDYHRYYMGCAYSGRCSRYSSVNCTARHTTQHNTSTGNGATWRNRRGGHTHTRARRKHEPPHTWSNTRIRHPFSCRPLRLCTYLYTISFRCCKAITPFIAHSYPQFVRLCKLRVLMVVAWHAAKSVTSHLFG